MAGAGERCRILLVDDEPVVVGLLSRVLEKHDGVFELEVAHGAQQAIERLEAARFDAVVTDLDMPEMDGAQLLEILQRRYPGVARLVYSGETLSSDSLRALASAHQFLGKYGGPRALLDALEQLCGVRELLRDKGLRALVGRVDALPSLPDLYRAVVDELASPETSLKRVGEIIGRDPSMTAKILQIVNSALFGLRTYVTDVAQAVAILGVDTIRTLVLSLEVFRAFESPLMRKLGLEALWKHSLGTATLARCIARHERLERGLIEQLFVAAMLHDVGKLVLWTNLTRDYLRVHRQAVDDGRSLAVLEREMIGASHGQVGGYLLALWGFPPDVVEAVAWHDSPSRAGGEPRWGVLTLVHVAAAIDRQRRNGSANTSLQERVEAALEHPYCEALGLFERLPAWIDLAERRGCPSG